MWLENTKVCMDKLSSPERLRARDRVKGMRREREPGSG